MESRFAKERQSFLRARSRIFSRAPRQPEAAAELHVRFPAGSLLDAHNSLLRAQKFPAQARREFARKPLNILAKVRLKTSSGQDLGKSPCSFPCSQGISRLRPVRGDCLHHQAVSANRVFGPLYQRTRLVTREGFPGPV